MIHFAYEPSSRAAFDAFWRGLLVADWEDPQGPMRFNSNLTLADVAASTFFQNTRAFFNALAESNGTAATATGNLNRAFVRQVFDHLTLPKLVRETICRMSKTFNEQEVWRLHIARIVSECAGLVSRRKKRFQLTRIGRELAADSQAGMLFCKLFLAYFRKFDLHYDFRMRDVPGIQQTMAVILWRLDNVARDWAQVRGLAQEILLPGVLAQLRLSMFSPYDKEEWILVGYVLNPLFDLGLVERKKKSESSSITEKDAIRVTSLWRKFISFAQFTQP